MYVGSGKPKGAIAMSGGHWMWKNGKGAGAHGLVDEVVEAWKMCKRTASILRECGIQVLEYYDTTSTNQKENVNNIIAWHKKQKRALDASFHLNALNATSNGCETLYNNSNSKVLATEVTSDICKAAGFVNRGAKYRDNVGFLVSIKQNIPAVLFETFFVGNKGDVEKYRANFEEICFAKAKNLAKQVGVTIKKEEKKPVENKESEGSRLLMFTKHAATLKAEAIEVLEHMVENDLLGKQWLDDFKDGKMTIDDAVGLSFIAMNRIVLKGGKK